MCRYAMRITATVFIILSGMAVRIQAAKFFGLGDLMGGPFSSNAFGISANGSVVVGRSDSSLGMEAFRWTGSTGIAGLGDLPGGISHSFGLGTSASGSVVVGGGNGTSGPEAIRWTASSGISGLGDLPGGAFNSSAAGVSGDGSIIVGSSDSAAGFQAFRWTAATGMVGLGDLPGGAFSSSANAISTDGSTIVGYSQSAAGLQAFRWTAEGGMVGLGDLPGGTFNSVATGVSPEGSAIVGYSTSASGTEAFRWSNNIFDPGMTGLGDLPGGTFNSVALGVAEFGSTVVGYSDTFTGLRAFIYDFAGMRDLKDYLVGAHGLGTQLQGWTLSQASAISKDGLTIVGVGTNPAGNSEAWLAYLSNTVYWYPQSSGDWDSQANWSGPSLPGPTNDVDIGVGIETAVTVFGPNGTRAIRSLDIDSFGVGPVTLRLDKGDLQVSELAILGDGAILVLENNHILSASTLVNHGEVYGSGTLNARLQNSYDGGLRVSSGESILVNTQLSNQHQNEGEIEAVQGSLEFRATLRNLAGGIISARDSTLRFSNGLINEGVVVVVGQSTDLHGDISSTGSIVVSGGADAIFYDDVIQNGTLRVSKVGSSVSKAIFLGEFSGSGGTSGGGEIFFEGDLRPGSSPAIVDFHNNVVLGPHAWLEIELGGIGPGTQHDQLNVTGDLALAGTLEVRLINGFTPTAGNSFDILNWGSLSGTFDTLGLPALGAGLAWNTSQLYTSGVLAVVAPTLPGDYNANGVVDAADYVLWRHTLGQIGAGLPADGNANGMVDQLDYQVWRAHFGKTLGSGATGSASANASGATGLPSTASVPEPSTPSLALLALVELMLQRRFFRRRLE